MVLVMERHLHSLVLVFMLAFALSLGSANAKIWTLITSQGLNTTWGDVSAISSVDDSILSIDMYPGGSATVTVWLVTHQANFTNPRIYIDIIPSTGFPKVDAQLVYPPSVSPYPSSPEELNFDHTGQPTHHSPWSSSSVYDIFPDEDDFKSINFIISDNGEWPFNPEGNEYNENILQEAATNSSNSYAQIELTILPDLSTQLGKYYMHIDSYGINTRGAGEFNPGSHDATVVINILPLVPSAGFVSMASGLGLLWRWRRHRHFS